MALPRLSMSGWNGHYSYSLQNNQRLSIYAQMSYDIRSLTSKNLHPRDSHQRPIRRSHNPACMLATSTANMLTGATTKHFLTVRAWTTGQQPTTLGCCTTQREQFLLSLMQSQHQRGLDLTSVGQDNRRVSGKLPRPQYRPSLKRHRGSKLLPTTIR